MTLHLDIDLHQHIPIHTCQLLKCEASVALENLIVWCVLCSLATLADVATLPLESNSKSLVSLIIDFLRTLTETHGYVNLNNNRLKVQELLWNITTIEISKQ